MGKIDLEIAECHLMRMDILDDLQPTQQWKILEKKYEAMLMNYRQMIQDICNTMRVSNRICQQILLDKLNMRWNAEKFMPGILHHNQNLSFEVCMQILKQDCDWRLKWQRNTQTVYLHCIECAVVTANSGSHWYFTSTKVLLMLLNVT